ncbi:sialic acid-binding Ig-like lectin 10 [Odontesthes bonariensis]|uniref:sialic acid-binding Ig-like lectin 10 n=1 Tax=Odontesthes bonariensis TaxID=219752 RepID=UPI003F58174A
MLFERDPSTIISSKTVNKVDSETRDSFWIDGLPRGEYEYGFKLEWGCNQTYIFPKKVHISVSALTKRPTVSVPPLGMTEGQRVTFKCRAYESCSQRVRIYWKWTKADGQSTVLRDKYFHRDNRLMMLHLTEDHHNTNISCVAEHKYDVVETTVPLTVKFSPKIQNNSHCTVEGELLVCVCFSRGNPPPPITWPLKTLTDYSVSSSSSFLTVSSTITVPAANYHNATVKCISSNEIGQAETETVIQNSTANFQLNYVNTSFDAVLPWITAVCFSLNLVLITILAFYIYKRGKRKKRKLQENRTYASLRRGDIEQEYSVISPSPR